MARGRTGKGRNGNKSYMLYYFKLDYFKLATYFVMATEVSGVVGAPFL